MFLEVDGLSKKWDQGVSSDWKTMDDDDEGLPNDICKLMNPSSVRITDLSGNGYGNDYDQIIYDDDDDNDDEISADEESSTDPPPKNNDGSINVRTLSLNYLRRRLITHSNIVFKLNKMKWPRHNTTSYLN